MHDMELSDSTFMVCLAENGFTSEHRDDSPLTLSAAAEEPRLPPGFSGDSRVGRAAAARAAASLGNDGGMGGAPAEAREPPHPPVLHVGELVPTSKWISELEDLCSSATPNGRTPPDVGAAGK